jgi:hypothetical protein
VILPCFSVSATALNGMVELHAEVSPGKRLWVSHFLKEHLMHSDRPFSYVLVGLSIATAATLTLSQVVQAQGFLQRVEERRAAMQQAGNPVVNSPQTNANLLMNAGSPLNAMPPTSALPAGDVSMVTLRTEMGPMGQQMVITPKGIPVPLPGPGVAGQAVQVYMGANGGYWYVDKNRQQVDLTGAVQQMQARASSAAVAPYTPPQYAPAPQTYMQNNPAATAAAAGLGAMAGAAMTSGSSWNTVPYGTPIHYGAAAMPYYNQGGKPVYINNSSVNDVNAYHATAVQEQQAWYHTQQAAQGANYKAWQQPVANPFVASSYANEYGAAAGAQAAHYGAAEGQQAARYGAAEGATAAHYGAAEGQQAARYGAAEGASAAHYGAQEGQQAARYGAAEGASAAHHGTEEGQQAARFGAAEGASASHHGAEEGQQARRFGAAEGAGAGRRGGRFGGEAGREGEEREGGRRR